MKILWKFQIPTTITKKVEVQKEIDGKNVTVLEDEQQTINTTYIIKKPNRADYDEAEFFYDKLFSENVRAGIITRSEVIKRFANEDVVIKKTYEDYIAKESELQRLNLQEKTEENVNKRTKVEQELLNILIDIQNFEMNKSSVFDRTAENRSRSKTIIWWILHLAYKLDGEKEVALFTGKDYKEKLEDYDRLMEENDPTFSEAIKRFYYYVPAWYTGQLNNDEDFRKAENMLKAEIQKQKESDKEVKAEEKSEIAPIV
jgi:hypothetical protein